MEIAIGNTKDGRLSTVYLKHNREEVEWNVEAFNRSTLKDVDNLFININGYLKSLAADLQDQLWTSFGVIHKTLHEVRNPEFLRTHIRKEIKMVYDVLDFDDLKRWIRIHGRIAVPSDLEADYSKITNQMTKRLTYPQDDYYDLAVLSVLLKPMVLIFGEYIRRMKSEDGTKFKEHRAFSLLAKSKIITLPAFERLRDYVDAKAESERMSSPDAYHRPSATFGGLGSEELPDWLLSRVLVRRICIHEETVGDNIVANAYHKIKQEIDQLDKTFNERVSPKRLYSSKSEEDNNSVAENYKIKQQISDGDLLVLSKYAEEMYDMAGRVDPTYDQAKIQACAKIADRRYQVQISKHHLTITQWVLSSAISPRGIPTLNKPSLLRAIAVAQGLLWHWGFYELATIMLADSSTEPTIAASQTPQRLGKQHIEIFERMYPHYQTVSKSQLNTRTVNPACKAIDALSQSLIQHDWHCPGPKNLLTDLGINNTQNYVHVVTAEIRQSLADLLIKIHNLKYNVSAA